MTPAYFTSDRVCITSPVSGTINVSLYQCGEAILRRKLMGKDL